ncbi:hypothetical protein SBV1_2060015 [Verrucomicrobia bacterium]|nr:hypothetical protein SBV1_2060015 [Verrucomicrobiota bacterium]
MRAGRNDRQAAAQFARCTQLAPNWAEPQLWLALHRIEEEDWAGALELSQNLQASGAVAGPTDLARLLFCRTTALQGLGRTNEAAASLQDFVDRGQAEALTAAAEVFAQNRQFKKALLVLEARLRQDPDQPALLEAKGWTEIKLARYDAADQTLSRALALAPSDERARLYRAVAFLGAGRFEAAREDYQVLLKGTSASRNALVGLGTFAWRHHETNAAIELYEQGLSNALPGSAQYKIASQALNQLREDRGAKPPPAE